MIRKIIIPYLILTLCITAGHSSQEKVTISSFTTSVEDQDSNVKTNIALASARLNCITIEAGKTFSFNDTVGDGSAANGYLAARVLYRDNTAYEPGGGICQVSSTLFNALLLAGCIITERHRHYQPVRYVPPGLDATIRYGKKDLKMRNPHSHALYIFTSLNDRSFTVIIKSEKNIQNSYEVYTEEETVNLPFTYDENKTLRAGLTVYVYRKKLYNGKILGNSLLYKDFYPPVYVEK